MSEEQSKEAKEEEYVEIPVEEETPKKEKKDDMFSPTKGMWPNLGI